MTRLPEGLVIEDWLAARLWALVRARIEPRIAELERLNDDVRRAARDCFYALFLCQPALDAGWAAHPAFHRHAERMAALLEHPHLRAAKSFTTGDEDACIAWVPVLLDALYLRGDAEQGDGAGARLGTARSGVDETMTDIGSRAPDRGARGSAGPADDMALLARLTDAGSARELEDLLDACTAGLLARTGCLQPGAASAGRVHGRDAARTRPDEWTAFCSSATETELWRRWSGRGLAYVLSPETPARGPLIVVGDESGSMDLRLDSRHSRRTWAKALALACAKTARAQRRAFLYIGYSSGGQVWRRWMAADADEREAASARAEICAHFFGSGTDCSGPVCELVGVLEAEGSRRAASTGGADIVFLNDGDCDIEDLSLVLLWNRMLEAAGASCWGIRIGAEDAPAGVTAAGMLPDLCHAVCDLEDFSADALRARYRSLAGRVR